MESNAGAIGAEDLSQRLASRPPRRVLILVRGHVGDTVNSTGAVRRIIERFPEAHITVDVGRGPAEVMRRIRGVREVWFRHGRRGLPGKFAEVRRIRKAAFDLGIVLYESSEAARHLRFAGVPIRVGIRRPNQENMFTASVPHREDQHDLFDSLPAVLRLLRANEDITPSIVINPEEERAVDQLLINLTVPKHRPPIGLHIGATTPRKQWPLENFQALSSQLEHPIILYGPGEEELAKQVAGRMVPRLLSLFEYAALIKKLDVLVTNDSGPAHIAGAVGTSEIVIFGPTQPHRFHPFGGKAICLWKPNHCDTFKDECEAIQSGGSQCDHRCLRRISVEDVLQAVHRATANSSTVPESGPSVRQI